MRRKPFIVGAAGLLIGCGLAMPTTASFIKQYEPMSQTVTAATFEVTGEWFKSGQPLMDRTLTSLTPGQISDSLIKIHNANAYAIRVELSFGSQNLNTASPSLFENPHVSHRLDVLGQQRETVSLQQHGTLTATSTSDTLQSTYVFELPAHQTLWLNSSVAWAAEDQEATRYLASKSLLSCEIIAKQVRSNE